MAALSRALQHSGCLSQVRQLTSSLLAPLSIHSCGRSYSDAPTNAPTSTANQHAAAQTGQASTSDPQAAAAAKPNDSTWAAPQSATNQPSMQRQHAQPASTSTSVSTTQLQQQTDELTIMRQKIDDLMKVLIQPMGHSALNTGQLSPHMVKVHGQYLIEPEAVLTSLVQALLVIKNVLKEGGHVYIVENNPLLRPILHEAANSCLNPNVWFYQRKWSPGMLTNYKYHKRFFKPGHQPNRRLFLERGMRMVNPHCPEPSPLDTAVPRLSWHDKWALYKRTNQPGYRDLLTQILAHEDKMRKLPAVGVMRGQAKKLQLLVFLDTTANTVAIQEAYQTGIPTIGLVNHTQDLGTITYPVLARDFHPNFVHFFLEWVLKVVNIRDNTPEQDMPAAATATAQQ
eukprot:jgi/Chrzof1/12361/Cz06g31250.t1